MSCERCDDTGWKPVDVNGVRRVVRCDCWREQVGQHRLADANIPKRYLHCTLDNFEAYKLVTACVSARDHDESYAMLADGKADAFATDDVLLYGFIVARKAEAAMAVVGDFITYEPYGIMFRRDDPLMAAAYGRASSFSGSDVVGAATIPPVG